MQLHEFKDKVKRPRKFADIIQLVGNTSRARTGTWDTLISTHSLYYHFVYNKYVTALYNKIRNQATKKESMFIEFSPKDIVGPSSV